MSELRYYEYRVEEVRIGDKMASDLQKWLNLLAREGWRLVAIENPYFFFEREEPPLL